MPGEFREYFFDFLRQIRDNRPGQSCRRMSRKRSQAATGQDRPHLVAHQGADYDRAGPLQFQARVRRTGRPAQIKTFETVAEAQAWGVGVLDGFNRNTFVDRRRETRTTLADVLERYKETGLTVPEIARSGEEPGRPVAQERAGSAVHRRDRIRPTSSPGCASGARRPSGARSATPTAALFGSRKAAARSPVRACPDRREDGAQRTDAAFRRVRFRAGRDGIAGPAHPVEDVPVKDKPKRRERTRRLRGDEEHGCWPRAAKAAASRSRRSSNLLGRRRAAAARSSISCVGRTSISTAHRRAARHEIDGRLLSRTDDRPVGARGRDPARTSPQVSGGRVPPIAPTTSRAISAPPASAPASRT